MKLEDLLAHDGPSIDRRGGRIALAPAVVTDAVRSRLRDLIASVSSHSFWRAAIQQQAYRPNGGLWAPQRRAVALALSYFAARSEGIGRDEAALIKMPTGTGKTAVIATLACAIPAITRTLVITPRRALVDQMLRDLHVRFWSKFDAIYDGETVRSCEADARADALRVSGPIWRLLPADAEALSALQEKRLVLVGTFTALEQILRLERSRHQPRVVRRRHTDDDAYADSSSADLDVAALNRLADLLRGFDLVVVDESHYEPAFVWSQCIRRLELPTVLFSATPYRNDFRYFSIKGRFAFNLSFQEAQREKLIRPVQLVGEADLRGSQRHADFVDRLGQFSDEIVGKAKPYKRSTAKIIVRAESHQSLLALQGQLKARRGVPSVLIHHREPRADAKTLRFGSATEALEAKEAKSVRLWLHQWKLLEGVDDSSFVGVAIHGGSVNTRALVQQIGRVLRPSSRSAGERAFVMAAPAIEEEVFGRWRRYLEYEEYFDRDPAEALRREAFMLDQLKAVTPELQYVGGDFRNRLDLSANDLCVSDFKLPCRAAIFRNSRQLDIDELAERCRDAMGSDDRHQAFILRPTKDEPEKIRVIPYVHWANSELLANHALPLWNLGLMVAVIQESRVFLLDTQRMLIEPQALGLEPETLEALQRLVPESTSLVASRVAQASAISLDLSDVSIRSITARMRDFSEGFFDLAETMQAATAMRAYLRRKNEKSTSRYLSLQRSAVSDSTNEYVTVARYVEWTGEIARALDSSARRGSAAFRRFAQAQPAPSASAAIPRNVLFDFHELLGPSGEERPPGWDAGKTSALLEADRCLEVDGHQLFKIEVGDEEFRGMLRYELTGRVQRRGRYVVECEELDDYLLSNAKGGGAEDAPALSKWLTAKQCFRVVPADNHLVYAQRHFYRPSINLEAIAGESGSGNPLAAVEASKWLEVVTSEKGEGAASAQDWAASSIFGGIYANGGLGSWGRRSAKYVNAVKRYDPAFAALLNEFSVIACDDGGAEFCDFVCVDEDRGKLVLIHAKSNNTRASLNALQEVGRQALASLAFVTRSYSPGSRVKHWGKQVRLGGKAGKALQTRIVKAERGDGVADSWRRVEEALSSASFRREIWIVASKTLSRGQLKMRLSSDAPTAHDLQILYYLAALETSIARANTRLRVFCSP